MATTKKAAGNTGPFTELEWSVFSIEDRSYRKFSGEMCEAYKIHSRLRNSLVPFTVLAKKGGDRVFYIEIGGFPVSVPFDTVYFKKRMLLLATPLDDLSVRNSSLVIVDVDRVITALPVLSLLKASADLYTVEWYFHLNLSVSMFDTMQKLANWAIG